MEEQEDSYWGDPELTPPAAPLKLALTTLAHGPDPSTSTTWGPYEQLPQPTSAALEQAPTVVEGGDFSKGGTSTHSASTSTSIDAR